MSNKAELTEEKLLKAIEKVYKGIPNKSKKLLFARILYEQASIEKLLSFPHKVIDVTFITKEQLDKAESTNGLIGTYYGVEFYTFTDWRKHNIK